MQIANLFARLGLKVDNSQFDKGLAKLNATRLAIAAVATYVSAKFAGAFITGTKEVLDFGEAIDDLSLRTGQSSAFLQKLAFAAGGGTEGLGKAQGALDKFGVRLREAVENPTNDTAKALEALGISIDDPRVRLGNLEQILQEVADKFETMPNGAQKNAIAFGLMSKSGLEMGKVLSELNEKTAIAEAAGAIMDKDAIAATVKAKDALEEMSWQWQAIKQAAVIEVLPALLGMFNKIRGWVKTNGDTIRKVLGGVLQFVVDKFHMIVRVIKDNEKFFKALAVVAGVALKAVMIGIDAIIAAAGALMKTFEIVGTAIGEAIGWVVTKAVEFWEWLGRIGEAVGAPFIAAFEWVGETWDKIVGKIEAAYKKVKGWIDEVTDAYDVLSGDREARMKSTIAAQDSKRSTEMAKTLLGRGMSQDAVTAKVASVYGSSVAKQAVSAAAKNVTVNAAPITVTINGANETPENLGLLFQRKVQEAQGVMLRDAAATLGGSI